MGNGPSKEPEERPTDTAQGQGAAAATSIEQAIAEQESLLKVFKKTEDTRKGLNDAVESFRSNLRTMRDARDSLAVIENQPGQLVTFRNTFHSVCTDTESMEAKLNEFADQANAYFDKSYHLQSDVQTPAGTAAAADTCQLELNRLEHLSTELQQIGKKLEERNGLLQSTFYKLMLVLKRDEDDAKNSLQIHIVNGCLAFFGVLITIAVAIGVTFGLRQTSFLGGLIQTAAGRAGTMRARLTEYFQDFGVINQKLKAIRELQAQLKSIGPIEACVSSLATIQVIQATMGAAGDCCESLRERLAERQKEIELLQENQQLREDNVLKDEEIRRLRLQLGHR